MPDKLDLALDRKVFLIYGPPGAGKSDSVVRRIQQMEEEGEHNVVLLDKDRGLIASIREVIGHVPENLDYFRIDTWAKLKEARDHCLSVLGPGDLCVIEGAHNIWKFARADYIKKTYELDEDEFMESKRHEAEARVEEELAKEQIDIETEAGAAAARKVRQRLMQFEGLDGRSDWPKITTKYHQAIGPLFESGDFDILTTTLAQRLDRDSAERWPEWVSIGAIPQGQKDLVAMHSTIAYMYQREGKFLWRTNLGDASKDRGNAHFTDVPMNDVGFWTSYHDKLEETK